MNKYTYRGCLSLLIFFLLAPVALAAEESIPEGFSVVGFWNWSSLEGFQPGTGGSMFSNRDDATAAFNPGFTQPVRARVLFYRIAHASNGNRVRIDVVQGGQRTTNYVDLRQEPSQWLDLGEYDFSGQEIEYVELFAAGRGNVRISAVRFEVLDQDGNVVEKKTIIGDTLRDRNLSLPFYPDIAEHPLRHEIEFLFASGRIESSATDDFLPDALINRETFLRWLAQAVDLPGVEALSAAGVWHGVPQEPAMAPEQSLDWELAVALLANAVDITGKDLSRLQQRQQEFGLYQENRLVSAWVQSDLERVTALGLIDPYREIAADAYLTRAEAAEVIKAFLQKIIYPGPPVDGAWQLTFQDEFYCDNWQERWNSHSGPSSHILSSRWPENIIVEDGLLKIASRRESRGGQEWTAGLLRSQFTQAYGYWEASYRYAPASGTHQSFWMITSGVSDEEHFEIDINEGYYPNRVNTNLHSMRGEIKHPNQGTNYWAWDDLSQDFHVYSALWNEEEIIYFFNGKEIYRAKNINAHSEVPAIVSQALSQWCGPLTDKTDGATVDFEWVRVWQQAAGEFGLKAPADGQLVTAQQVVLSWAPSARASTYTVEVAADAEFQDIVYRGKTQGLEYMLEGLFHDRRYYWRVGASPSGADLITFNEAGARSLLTTSAAKPPAAPIVSVQSGMNIVHLAWEPIAEADWYVLYRSQPGQPLLQIGSDLKRNQMQYTDILDAPGDYTYTVIGYNNVGGGPASAEVVATVAATDVVIDEQFAPDFPAAWNAAGNWSGEDGRGNVRALFPRISGSLTSPEPVNPDYAVEFTARINEIGNPDFAILRLSTSIAASQRYQLLYWHQRGEWELYRRSPDGNVLVATEPMQLHVGQWHQVKMRMAGGKLEVFIDGRQLFDLSDPAPLGEGLIEWHTGNMDVDLSFIRVLEGH